MQVLRWFAGYTANWPRRRSTNQRVPASRSISRLRLGLALAVSLIVLACSPAIGQIRGAIQSAFPNQYRLILGATVALSIGSGVVYALVAIRERRALRLGLIALAVVIAAGYAFATATGNANVDAVERFHFV